MLQALSINNIALIVNCSIELENKLNILSGETGAGKSIIIDSLNYVLGSRTDKSLIRFGESFARVEATFCNLNDKVKKSLLELGFEPEDLLIINRKMNIDGKNEIRLNGRIVTLSMLRSVTDNLIDIVGQHENQFLLKSQYHIDMLDSYGAKTIENVKEKFIKNYKEYNEISAKLNSFGDEDERVRSIDLLHYQIKEIEDSNLKENEYEDLINLRKRMLNTEKIVYSLKDANNNLSDIPNSNVIFLLNNTFRSISQITEYDERLNEINERIESCLIELKDISFSLNDIIESYEFDGNSLESVESRISKIRSIFKKYGGDYNGVQDYYNTSVDRLKVLESADEEIKNLNEDLVYIKDQLQKSALELSGQRRSYAIELQSKITKELQDLGMSGTTFSINFNNLPNDNDVDLIRINGLDRVEFLISPNIGAPLMPLSKIASGGEMSRIMLAVKSILADLDQIDTVVFDEIDTGISGNVANIVANKMAKLSRNRQIIAVTHLPQIAAMADNHMLIKKSSDETTTTTMVTSLDKKMQIAEISRLLGGNSNSESAINHAINMKDSANSYKQSI